MAEVKLFKQARTYKNDKGEDVNTTNFYLRCGEELIPIRIPYFGKDGENDPQYAPRRAVLSAFAENLPPKEGK